MLLCYCFNHGFKTISVYITLGNPLDLKMWSTNDEDDAAFKESRKRLAYNPPALLRLYM